MPQKIKSDEDFVLSLADRLKQAARRPNVTRYRAMPKQELFHKSKAHGRLYIGGNRSGKTVGGGVEAVWWATGKHPYQKVPEPPTRGRVCTVDFDHGLEKIVKPEIARWIPPSELINGSWEDSYAKQLRTLTLANNSEIEFMSYEQDVDKFAGTSRHWIWYDEEPPEPIFNECSMRLVDTGGHWWISMTPVEGMTWTYERLYVAGKTSPNIDVIEVDIEENVHLSPAEIEIALEGLDEDDKQARKSGKYVQVGGLIYDKYYDKYRNVLDPFIPPSDWLHLAGMDHGLANPTVWLWSAVDPDGTIVVYDEHYEAGQLINYHARKVHEKNAEHRIIPRYYVGDPSIAQRNAQTGMSIQIQYVELGIPIVLGNNDVKSGIDKVAEYFKGIKEHPRLFITRNCERTLWELPRYRWAVWKDKKMQKDKNKKEEPHKKDDHACDTLRYIVASRPEYDTGTFVPVPELGSMGAPESVSIDRIVDQKLLTPARQPIGDPHLGEEF